MALVDRAREALATTCKKLQTPDHRRPVTPGEASAALRGAGLKMTMGEDGAARITDATTGESVSLDVVLAGFAGDPQLAKLANHPGVPPQPAAGASYRR